MVLSKGKMGMSMDNYVEKLDVRTPDGEITGVVKERSKVHRDGDIHGTSHIWLIRKKNNNKFDILLQKRAATKDAYAGCYDISSAGHVTAGHDYLETALRELKEELGVIAQPEELEFIGYINGVMETEFNGVPFINHEISAVYVYECYLNENEFQLQKEEVESVLWMDFDECRQKLWNGQIRNCIFADEFKMLEKALR